MDKGHKTSEEKNNFQAGIYNEDTCRAGVLHPWRGIGFMNFADSKGEAGHKIMLCEAD